MMYLVFFGWLLYHKLFAADPSAAPCRQVYDWDQPHSGWGGGRWHYFCHYLGWVASSSTCNTMDSLNTCLLPVWNGKSVFDIKCTVWNIISGHSIIRDCILCSWRDAVSGWALSGAADASHCGNQCLQAGSGWHAQRTQRAQVVCLFKHAELRSGWWKCWRDY